LENKAEIGRGIFNRESARMIANLISFVRASTSGSGYRFTPHP